MNYKQASVRQPSKSFEKTDHLSRIAKIQFRQFIFFDIFYFNLYTICCFVYIETIELKNFIFAISIQSLIYPI